MKENKTYVFILFISIQLLFNFRIVNSFGIKDVDPHLLIYYLEDKKQTDNLSEEKYMKEIMYKDLYSKFKIGVPSQNIKFYYEMNNYESSISEELYYIKRSTTYKLIDKRFLNISNENNIFEITDPNGYLSKEILELSPEKKIENFTFLLKPKNKNEKVKNTNALGLNFNIKNNSHSLLSLFKEKNYISQKVFSFLSGDDSFSENSEYDGQVLIGCYPHDISPYFDEEELYFTSLNNKDDENWHINFDSVKYKEDELKDKKVELDINLNVIIGPEKFREKLINTLFRDFIHNKKCKENYFTSDKTGEQYIFYTFDKDVMLKEIPILTFYSKDLNETFKLSFTQLFEKYRERYYFKIIFKKNPDNKWVFGQIFFNTYKFVFNIEEGKIGYYKSYSHKNHPIIALIIIAVFVFIFVVGYLRGLSVKKRDALLYGNKPASIPVRKEYANGSSTDINKDKNNKTDNDKKEENKNENNKDVKKDDNKKLKKD